MQMAAWGNPALIWNIQKLSSLPPFMPLWAKQIHSVHLFLKQVGPNQAKQSKEWRKGEKKKGVSFTFAVVFN